MGTHAGRLNGPYRQVLHGFYRGAGAVLIVFDTNSRDSLLAVRQHYDDARRQVDNAVFACCGFVDSKADGDTDRAGDEAREEEGETTRNAGREVSEEEARALCDEIGAEYFEVDLGVDDGRVDTLLDTLTRQMIDLKGLPETLNNNT